jgi:hypothetical protein
MSSMIHSFISWELAVSRERKKKGVRKDSNVSSGCDVEEGGEAISFIGSMYE